MIRSLSLSALLATSTALGAAADVTPEDVWSNTAAVYAALGFTVTGDLRRDGDTLTIGAPRATATLPFGIGTAELALGDLRYVDAGDGSVILDQSEPLTMTFSADITIEGERAGFRVDLLGSFENPDLRAAGTPGDVTYTSLYDGLTITVTDIAVTGVPDLDRMTASGAITIGASETVSRVQEGDLLRITGNGASASSNIDMTIDIPGEFDSATVELTGSNGMTTTSSDIAIPADIDIMNLSAALRDGLSFSIEDSREDTTSRTVTRSGDIILSDQIQTAALATQTLRFDEAGLFLSGTSETITVDIPSDMMIPVPVSLRAATASGVMRIPVNAADAPQDAQVAIDLSGFEMSDDLWALFDPQSVLPRDPARVAFDLSADLTVMADLLDVNGLSEMAARGLVPAEVTSVTLSSVNLDMVGATLSGSGAFTLDNDDMATFPGIPRPEGSASFQATGINALIDNLLAMGLMTDEDAFGARMGMSLVLAPAGEDAFTSEVVIDEDGALSVNGQRLR